MLRFLPLLILLAVAIYWGVSVLQKRNRPGGGGTRRIDRPRGPDDDPDFLRKL